MDWSAIELSLRLSTLTMLLLLILGLPLASWPAFSRWRWKFFLEAVVTLPIVLPPTVLGFYVLIAIGPHSPIGQAYAAITGRGLPFSFQGLLIASVLYSLPFAVQPFTDAISTVDQRLIEASWCLSRGWLGTFFRVTLPLAWPGILTGMVLSFAHTLGEFGVVLMIGGDLAGVTRTISISIFDQVQALDYGAANQTALALLLFSFLVLAITYGLQRRVIAVWPPR
jgi:molybdate transport system permease protein